MTKKIITLLMTFLLIFSLVACGKTSQRSENYSTQSDKTKDVVNDISDTKASEEIEKTDTSQSIESENTSKDAKTLVVYFSWSTSGNTEKMATYIQEHTGADILELISANPYPTDYNETRDVAKVERDENARPQIANLSESINQYDTIFVGYPIWWHTAPMIIGIFLDNYNLTGVDIYPFSQSASMDMEQFNNSMDFVRENAAGANVHDGLFVQAENTEGITSYMKANGFDK